MTIQDPGGPAPEVFNVVLGQAGEVRSTPFGDVGTVFFGQGIEMAWVSKLAEPIDPNWFSSDRVDLILVVQGQLKFELESPGRVSCRRTAGPGLTGGRGNCRAGRS